MGEGSGEKSRWPSVGHREDCGCYSGQDGDSFKGE
jgi:hypothetical protein